MTIPTAPVTHRPITVRLREALLQDVVDVVAERFDDPDLTLEDVARAVAASRRQVQRVLEEGGSTFRLLVARTRMAHAAELLATTNQPIREIARRVGYRQPAQFAKAFRRQSGRTPMAYREAALARPVQAGEVPAVDAFAQATAA